MKKNRIIIKINDNIKMLLPYVIFALVIVIILYFVFDLRNSQLSEIEQDPKFSIATTLKKFKSGKGSWKIQYTFRFKDESYIDDCEFNKQINIHRGRYYVIFSALNPNNSELLEIAVPDSIAVAPNEGWNYLPGFSYHSVKELWKELP